MLQAALWKRETPEGTARYGRTAKSAVRVARVHHTAGKNRDELQRWAGRRSCQEPVELVRGDVGPDDLPVIVDAVRLRVSVRVDDRELTCLPQEADLIGGITVQTAISHNHTGIVYAVSKRCIAAGVIDGSECTAVINEAERIGRNCVIAGDVPGIADGVGIGVVCSGIMERTEGAVVIDKASSPVIYSDDLIAVVDPFAAGGPAGAWIVEGRENAILVGEAVRLCEARFVESGDHAAIVNPLRKGGTFRIINGGVHATGVKETVVVAVLRVKIIANDGAAIVDGRRGG